MTILVFIVILGLLIFVHEAGHFFAARAAKIKVEEFAFGFPPRLFSITRGETRYSLNLIPLGGYVKMLGEEQASNDPRSFNRQPLWIKLIVIIAGVFMNLVLALLVLWIGFMTGMAPIVSNPADFGGEQISELLVTGVRPHTPAEDAGLKLGDIITGFDKLDDFQAFTRENAGKTVPLSYRRGNEQITQNVTLTPQSETPLGVGLFQLTKVKLAPIAALKAAFIDAKNTVILTAQALGDFQKKLFTKGEVGAEVSGPVGIYKQTGLVVQLGWSYVLQLLAGLSLSLAFLNIVPIPPLDGGGALFAVLEKFIRRKATLEQVKAVVYLLGFLFIIGQVILVTYFDIRR